jgi:hypothetical protein
MHISVFLAYLSGAMFVPVIFIYLDSVKKGKSNPNPASWIMWTFVSILNTILYYFVTNKDMNKLILMTVATILITVLTIIIGLNSKFTKLKSLEIWSIGISLAVIPFWLIFRNAVASHFIVNGILLAMFYPTIKGVLSRQAKENPFAWWIPIPAYLVNIPSIVLSPKGWHWYELVYPIAIGIIGNGSVAFCAYIMNQKKRRYHDSQGIPRRTHQDPKGEASVLSQGKREDKAENKAKDRQKKHY